MLPGVLTSLGSSQTSSYYQGWGSWAEIPPVPGASLHGVQPVAS